MTPSDIQFAYFAAIVAVYTALLLAFALLALNHGQRVVEALVRWCRQTFTKAGDGCHTCNGWAQPVYCLSCHHVRMLRAAETVTRHDPKVVLADFEEERRRRDALTAFNEIDLDLDETAVN